MKAVVYCVKVFSSNCDAGNLAGVVPDATGLSDADMKRVAAWVGASETAFVFPSSHADPAIRWFSPTTEVRMCVHATIAAAGVLLREALAGRRLIRFKSGSNSLLVRVAGSNLFVRVPGYRVGTTAVRVEAISQALRIDRDVIVGEPKTIALAGDTELVVEVRDLQTLHGLVPDRETYSHLCRRARVGGISVCATEVLDRSNDLHMREFAPCYGYLEDPVCGVGAGAVVVSLRRRFQNKNHVRVEQGISLKTPGVVFVAIRRRRLAIGGDYIICDQHHLNI
jgi:PhzF family phenazine biosynthesis protein